MPGSPIYPQTDQKSRWAYWVRKALARAEKDENRKVTRKTIAKEICRNKDRLFAMIDENKFSARAVKIVWEMLQDELRNVLAATGRPLEGPLDTIERIDSYGLFIVGYQALEKSLIVDAAVIRKAIERRGWNATQLARESCLSIGEIDKAMTGVEIPDFVAKKIAKTLMGDETNVAAILPQSGKTPDQSTSEMSSPVSALMGIATQLRGMFVNTSIKVAGELPVNSGPETKVDFARRLFHAGLGIAEFFGVKVQHGCILVSAYIRYRQAVALRAAVHRGDFDYLEIEGVWFEDPWTFRLCLACFLFGLAGCLPFTQCWVWCLVGIVVGTAGLLRAQRAGNRFAMPLIGLIFNFVVLAVWVVVLAIGAGSQTTDSDDPDVSEPQARRNLPVEKKPPTGPIPRRKEDPGKNLAVEQDQFIGTIEGYDFTINFGTKTKIAKAVESEDGTLTIYMPTTSGASGFIVRGVDSERVSISYSYSDNGKEHIIAVVPREKTTTRINVPFAPKPIAGTYILKVTPPKSK